MKALFMMSLCYLLVAGLAHIIHGNRSTKKLPEKFNHMLSHAYRVGSGEVQYYLTGPYRTAVYQTRVSEIFFECIFFNYANT